MGWLRLRARVSYVGCLDAVVYLTIRQLATPALRGPLKQVERGRGLLHTAGTAPLCWRGVCAYIPHVSGRAVCVCARAFSFHCIQHGPRPRVASWQLRMGARARARSPRLHTPFDWLLWLRMTAGVRRVLGVSLGGGVCHWSCGFFVCYWPTAGCLWKKAVCSGAHVVANHCMVQGDDACVCMGLLHLLGCVQDCWQDWSWPCAMEQARTCLCPCSGLVYSCATSPVQLWRVQKQRRHGGAGLRVSGVSRTLLHGVV